MKSNILIFGILILLVTFGSIRFLEDNDYAQESFTLLTNVDNRQGTETIENARVKFIVMDDIDVFGSSLSTNIGKGDIGSKKIYTDLPKVDEPKEVFVRIYIYGDDGERRIKHRPLIIG